MVDLLKNKVVVITGATSGIGLAVAESLARQAAWVIGVGRTQEHILEAQARVQPVVAPGGRCAFLVADLALQSEVRRLARDISDTISAWGVSHLDTLINNAATVPFWQTYTLEGFDMQWAVNHLAAFLLTMELLPLLRAAPAARVLTVSSGSHYNTRLHWEDVQMRRRYNPLSAYQQTKLANVLFTYEFNRRYSKTSSLQAFAADPGLVNTQIGLKSNSSLARWIWNIRRRGGVRPEEAARGIVYLVAEPSIQGSNEVYWMNSKPKRPSTYAMDPQAARQLWEVSAQMCGIS